VKPNVIGIAADGAQFPPAAFLAQKLAAMNPRDDTDVLLVSDSARDLGVANAWGGLGCKLALINSGIRFTGDGRVSGAAFYRLALPRLSGARRLLYLDTDTFPDSAALFDLFDLDMRGHAIAAVRDVEVTCLDTPIKRAELNLAGRAHDRRYFNSGVLLVDTDCFEQQTVENRCLREVAANDLHDQAALNKVMNGQWLELSPAFNMTPIAYLAGLHRAIRPVITHFMGRAKPWHGALFYLDHPARREIEAFIPRSPWPTFLAGNPTSEMVKIEPWTPPAAFIASLADYLRETGFAGADFSLGGATAVPAAKQF